VIRRSDVLVGGAAATGSLVAAAIVLRIWHLDWHVPLDYSGDTVLNLTVIKTVIDHGWYLHNPDLGLPHGQDLYDYPVVSGETLNLLVFRLSRLLTGDPVVVLNVFYLLTFPLAAATAYAVLRWLRADQATSFVGALLFTLLPYHFMRGEVHIFLAAYYAVPLGAYLGLAVLRGEDLISSRRRLAITLGACIVVATASGSFYYAAFTVLLVLVATLLRAVVQRDPRAVLPGCAVVGAIAVLSVVQLAPTLVYHARHGENDEVAKRYWFESENYSLRVTNLVLPVDNHRIGWLAGLKDEYTQAIPQNEARTATLGVVGTFGFLWLLAVVLAVCAGAASRYELGWHPALAVLTLVSLLTATTGGFATLLGVIWPQIRSWDRISVFIAFFALAAVALGLSALGRRLPKPAYGAVLVAVLAVGILDQTTDAFTPPYAVLEEQWDGDRAFVSSVEREVPQGSSLVEVPYEPFPEPALGGRQPYEPAKPYLHSDDLRWSWGAMRGRPADWMAAYAGKPAVQVVAAARERGFQALLLDRAALGPQGPAVATEYRGVLGRPTLTNFRYDLWSL
jgi:phosphoglycerol transferase